MDTKSFDARIKAVGTADGLKDGQFRALVSVFNTVDSYGDVVMPGAFTEDLERWNAKGDLIPVVWSHQWIDPFAHIGYALEAEQSEKGLEILGHVDTEENPTASQVLRLLKGRRVTQFSFAFEVEDAGFGTRGEEEVFELRKLKTYEVGPTLIGVNQDTELLAVKAAKMVQAKALDAGRAALAPREIIQLRAAYKSIGELLPPEDPQTPAAPAAVPSEPSQPAEPPTDEVLPEGKPDPVAKGSPRRARALALARSY